MNTFILVLLAAGSDVENRYGDTDYLRRVFANVRSLMSDAAAVTEAEDVVRHALDEGDDTDKPHSPPDWTGWTGPCDRCSTDHGGFDPDTTDGRIRCGIARAEASGSAAAIESARAMEADFQRQRDEGLRKMGHDPDEARRIGMLPPQRWRLPPGFPGGAR